MTRDRIRSGDRLVTKLTPAINHWAARDPAGAVQWMESINTEIRGTMRRDAYRQIAEHWPKDSLSEAVAWLVSQGESDRSSEYDRARGELSGRMYESDPLGAIETANHITDPYLRERYLVAPAQLLYQRDPQTLLEWLPERGLSEENQRLILSPAP